MLRVKNELFDNQNWFKTCYIMLLCACIYFTNNFISFQSSSKFPKAGESVIEFDFLEWFTHVSTILLINLYHSSTTVFESSTFD